MLGLLTAWRHVGWRTRPFHLLYASWMAVAAVYLDHHWVLDVLSGWLVACVAVFLSGEAMNIFQSRAAPSGASVGLRAVEPG